MDIDLELSDGEKEPAPPARKGAKAAEVASPTKRGPPVAEGVSLDVLKDLLREQTREIKGSLKEELREAIQGSEAKMSNMVARVQQDLETKMDAHAKDVAAVKDLQDRLLVRVNELEGKANAAPAPAPRKPTILFGGWQTDTRKAVILSDIEGALKQAGADVLVDQQPWVPGARHSIGLSEVRQRQGEAEAERDKRMHSIIALINDPKLASQKLAAGRTLWATVSRPRLDKGHGSHASKVRRLLHNVEANFQEVEAVYVSGSVWHKDLLVASVDRPKNGPHVKQGKIAGSWVDMIALAKTTGKKAEELEALWSQIMG